MELNLLLNRFGSINDQLFKDVKRLNDDFYIVSGNGHIGDYIPWLRPFYYKRELAIKDMTKTSLDVTKERFVEHKKSFTPGIIQNTIYSQSVKKYNIFKF